ncbi:MAG TPA: hypothetical protein VFX85_09585 [Solirubrobacterales bacterium]|nr:hypothetical protein [Solirubrobacterales bacterium]
MIRRALVAALTATAMLMAASSAAAEFEVKEFSGLAADSAGNSYTQAGGHPYAVSATIGVPDHPSPDEPVFYPNVPDGNFKNIHVEFPRGLVGNPSAVRIHCSEEQVLGNPEQIGSQLCPVGSQVGTVRLWLGYFGVVTDVPLYAMEPRDGVPATFAFAILGSVVRSDAQVRGGDYRIGVDTTKIPQLSVYKLRFTLWGTPADPSHDPERSCLGGGTGCSTEVPRVPFMTNPTHCAAGAQETRLRMDSWQQPGVFHEAGFAVDENGNPTAVDGCEKVPFEPAIEVTPQSAAADSPTGLEVAIDVPQDGLADPGGIAASHLRGVKVLLPEGMAVNPASASGLGSCTTAQIGLGSEAPVRCPAESKIGEVAVDTPLLEEPLGGDVFLARQGDNPFGSLLALYIVAEGSGVRLKLPGRVDVDPTTGRLEATFEDNPQLPFERLRVKLFGGPRASLLTPPACGTYESQGTFTPWSGGAPVVSRSSFQVTSGPNGAPCPAGSFAPRLEAGTVSPIAGEHSPFVLRVSREDGTQRLGSLSATLPPGLLAKLSGVTYCPEAALAGISGAAGSGAAQHAAPSCPAASRVGGVTVSAGGGSSPFNLETGRAYLAGPYKGAPLSLAAITPALAGPFDLGSVLVRSALRVDPVSAQVTAETDSLPTILHGIPLDLRALAVSIDREHFTLNPTSCARMQVDGTVRSASGQTSRLAEPFQARACRALDFEPALGLKLKGKTSRGSYQQLRAELKAQPGQANIGRASVTMPRSIFLAQENIGTLCTRPQFAAEACPKGSIYGRARAVTPLLDQPLEGNVYLRANGGERELPDLVADLRGQIDVELVGYIDSADGGIRTRFQNVPDAPVSRFVLNMKGGKKSLLVASRDLCKSQNRAKVKLDGQNGKAHDFRPQLKVSCGKKR